MEYGGIGEKILAVFLLTAYLGAIGGIVTLVIMFWWPIFDYVLQYWGF